MEEKDTILFFNTPITDEEKDLVGIGKQVNKVIKALDSNAQMIAITSPFGSGKTSLIELLKARRKEQDKAEKKSCFIKWIFARKERIVSISMWSQLQGQKAMASIDLHRSFLYRIINEVKPRRAAYVKNYLDPNYGLIGLHTNRPVFWILTVITLVFAALAWLINILPERFQSAIPPFFMDHADTVSVGSFFLAVVFAIIIITRARILFSLKRPNEGRKIEVDDVVSLYRTELLKPRKYFKCLTRRAIKGTHYVFIIEDLDRTNDPKAVFEFLSELRKYCITDSQQEFYNSVCFVVNIKPERVLQKQSSDEKDRDSLYEKIFDYVLNLQTINIDNYDAILEGLLKSKENELKALGLAIDSENIVNSLPAMQWIIREKCQGIREIKDRLNTTFTLYESLKAKFPRSSISLESCAAVSYLTTAFAQDFYALNGREFENLVDTYLKAPASDSKVCDLLLPNSSPAFKAAVWQMVQSKIIDSTYRSYFYNYPKGSKLYTSDERCAINAILYNAEGPNLDQSLENIKDNPTAIIDAFQKISQLGVLLPDLVLTSEKLYLLALRYDKKELITKLSSLDYSTSGIEKTIQTYMTLLSYDKERIVFSSTVAREYCAVWVKQIKEGTSILRMRTAVCKGFPQEAVWYKSLFFSPYRLITKEEMSALGLTEIMKLINYESDDFSAAFVQYIQSRYSKEESPDELREILYEFFSKSLETLNIGTISSSLLDFMITANVLFPDLERAVLQSVLNENDGEDGDEQESEESEEDTTTIVDVAELIEKYASLVNQIAANVRLSKQTLQYVDQLDTHTKYSFEVATQLRSNGYWLKYILVSLSQGYEMQLAESETNSAILKNCAVLLRDYPTEYLRLRERVVSDLSTSILSYSFLFDRNDCPIMTKTEFDLLTGRPETNEDTIMALIKPRRVERDQLSMLCGYFCRKKQSKGNVYNILCYIAEMEPALSKELFYMLDFSMIPYRYIAAGKKDYLKQLFTPILDLDKDEEKLNYMIQTKYLDQAYEKALFPAFQNDRDLYLKYIEFLNKCDHFTEQTMGILSKCTIYAMSPAVTEALYEAGKHRNYIASKTMWEKEFILEDGEKGAILWPSYLQAFNDDHLSVTRGYMGKNKEFLLRIKDEHAYTDFRETGMLPLSSVSQNVEMIKHVAEAYSHEFSLAYYQQIIGFDDRSAAKTMLELIKERDDLLASIKLYYNIHDKLVDPVLKRKYTLMRKNYR